ncbi:MAG TPA: UDP-glucose/GDP-mannose dehydrogenase family protein [Candidatus Saccharimonadales bacterium]|nr:UDP-glucose/GDP-mannose dehydrogenase family protein [Candidatus Saccharimonadales bacterium]
MKVTIIGTGYVGLVTGTCLAEIGHEVVCVDIDKAKIERLQKGDIPIYEPGLAELVHKNQQAKRLIFVDSAEKMGAPQVVFFALPTPPGADGEADLRFVLGAAADTAKIIKDYTVFVNKSTVPVGTAGKVREAIAKHTKVPFDVVSNPEFLREGFAVTDFMDPDRIVVGVSSDRARKVMEEVYQPFTSEEVTTLLIMDEASSEMTKYAANSFLATKISFMNEIANLCEKLGANVDSVRHGIGLDERIGMRFLYPGLGYGGSCFPKDVLALATTAKRSDYDFKILQSVMDVNARQKELFTQKIKNRVGDVKGKTFAVWGLAFKPDTDDIREAPALHVIQELVKAGANVRAYDPEAIENTKRALSDTDVTYAGSAHEALEGADILVVVTEWKEFASVEPGELAKKLRDRTVFDGRNIFEPAAMKQAGLTYISIGREEVVHG